MMLKDSQWITVGVDMGDVCPVFRGFFSSSKEIVRAELSLTALGIYQAKLNGTTVGNYVLAPGWTSYSHRLQVQQYDVTTLMKDENELCITVGRGWFRSPMPGWFDNEDKHRRVNQPCGIIGSLDICYADGTKETFPTDTTWKYSESPFRFSEIYDGEIYDARFIEKDWLPIQKLDWSKDILIHQEGEEIHEIERIDAKEIIITPKGETVIDFGQEVTGYVEFHVSAKEGDIVYFTHGEMLDASGNFYNENYRSAKAEVKYYCRDGEQTWHPQLTFFGFRYIKLFQWPGEARVEDFTAIVVHSALKRTGWLASGSPILNQLFSNIVWGQKGNFLDIPTDCPQRDERLGWTGDAQVFVKTASYFFDVERFFQKWLHDLKADQRENGEVGQVIPDLMPQNMGSAAWGDAAVICPWQIYQTYGDKTILCDQFESMKKWIDFIGAVTQTPNLWTGWSHFGDWLGLDAPSGSYKGSTREDFIATAFYARSTELFCKTGEVLGKDMGEYWALYERIVSAFRQTFPTYMTQTEYVLALQFHLTDHPQETADALAERIIADGSRLRTGFVGTPYLLHVLSNYGHEGLAWSLLLREEYPGWLYSVTKGATTIWEHWDGVREDNSFWSKDMNSFNHYSYGAVADWVFERAAGIRQEERAPGFSHVLIAPQPDRRIGWLEARLATRCGLIRSKWFYVGDSIRYEIQTEVPATIRIGGMDRECEPGDYTFWQDA